ncbi:GntR family transcriptional regulator [Lutibaculum baratangense]|uniref:Transcriptional regulator, GntR family n=1 Tax=Lutibaculum baratangense AMV1 TaxID=631454 RepID=V4TAJ8_9HYPH|nr:GntR family transcriptional regulator [Lutibaculum baratangense]ESR23453.1 transcriptional regulator, GntR family [Lutibaculum baratangense AMV1]
MSMQEQAAAREKGMQRDEGPARRVSLRDQAYRLIKQQIITCELRPGEVLSEAAVSTALGIGRTPVHQALDRLMVDGLVEVLPRKGVMVRPLSLHEALEIIDVRVINETYCARLAAQRAERGDVEVLRDNLDGMRRASRRREINELMRLDREFHSALSAAGRNSILSDFLANLHDRAQRFWFVSLRAPDHHDRVCEQHAAIVDAIAAHDPDGAAEAMRFHIEAFRTNVTRQI